MAGNQPWFDLPAGVTDVLRPVLSAVADEIIEGVRTVPAYARPLDGEFGAGVRAGVEGALAQFLAEIESGRPAEHHDVYRRLGRGEMRSGRSLDALLSAYRIGARVAWRRFASAGESAGLEPPTMYLLAESIFAYIDVLSAESADGYALEQSAVASQAEMGRRRLVRMLVREPPAEPAAVQAAADEVGWELPRALAVLVVSGVAGVDRDGALGALGARLPSDTISDGIGELVCVIVPDPDAPGRRASLQQLVSRLRLSAGLGATVAWPEALVSFTRARAALGLARLPGELVVARERAGELLLASSPAVAAEFVRDRLAPLATLRPASRDRLTETLRAWLAEQGRLNPVALALGVHPQTARYRIARLRELFGAALDDPDERFWLALALRVSPAGVGSAPG
jgi:hypothetical protein